MVKLRPQLKNVEAASQTTPNSLTKMKYSVLVSVVKKQKPDQKKWRSMEVTIVNREDIEKELLSKQLLESKGDSYSVTARGEQFMAEFEKAQKSE